MKAKKLLAVLLAVLMVIPAMVMPTAAADATAANAVADPYELTYEFVQFEASETPYLVQEGKGSDGTGDWKGRNGEGNGTIWKFPLSNPSQIEDAINKLTKFTVTARTRSEVVLSLSLDNANYTEVYSIMTDPALSATASSDEFKWSKGSGLNPFLRTYDFTDELYALLKNAPKAEYVYLKLTDVLAGDASTVNGYTPVGGYGGMFIKDVPVVVEINYDKDTCWAYDQFIFTPGQDDETQYRYDASATFSKDATGWFLDETPNSVGTKFIQWVYELTDSALPEKLTWSATVGQNLLLEFSVDNKNWVEIFNEVPNNNKNLKFYNFDITEAYLNARAASPSNMLYVRMSNSNPGNGWGGKINFAPATLTAGCEKQLSGDFITLDWTVQGEDENLYWAGGATPKTGYYYADKGAKGVVRYPITNADLSGEILFTAKVGSQFLLKVSLDGVNYVDAFIYNNAGVWETDKSSCKGFATTYRTFDLAAAVKEAAKVADSKDNLYVAFGDSEPSNGWGGQLHGDVTLNIRSVDGMEYAKVIEQTVVTGPLKQHTDGKNWVFDGDVNTVLPWGDYRKGQFQNYFDATAVTDGVLMGTLGSNPSIWYADGGYYTLRYQIPAGLTAWQFSATFGGDLGLYYAYTTDAKTPHPEKDFDAAYADNMVWNYVDDNDGTRLHPRVNKTFTVETTDEMYAKGGYIHLLIVDYSWCRQWLVKEEGYTDNSSGWGPSIAIGKNYPITLAGFVPTENELCNTTKIGYVPYAHTVKESFSISKVKIANEEKQQYTFAETEPVLVAAATTAGLSIDMPASRVFTDEQTGELYTTGDGNWNGRFGDGKVIVYRYELPKYATKFDWTARVGGDYGIYMAYASDTPADDEWTLVKNFLSDGYELGQHPNVTNMTISDDISADELANGYVYLKFVDYDYQLYGDYYGDGKDNTVEEPVLGDTVDSWIKTRGYGCRIPMGSNYSVDMLWTVSGEDRDVAYSVSSAQLSLTENFNLNFKLNLPVSSKGDENVTITWADGTPAEKVEEVNGGYLVKDILPQDMTKDLVVTFSGTCMDNTKYTSKTFTYSVKDYCMRMISKNPTDAKLVALLSDALVYGAAAQKYVFDDGELATDAVVGLKPSTFKALDKAAYADVLSGEAAAQGTYKWAGVTLVLDNTVTIRYTLYTEAAAPTVMVNGKAYTPVADQKRANYYTVDVPVMAGDFATEYVASFDGVEGYTVTYSVNHYVARKYNPNTLVTGDLIEALYNYGASAAAYAAK